MFRSFVVLLLIVGVVVGCSSGGDSEGYKPVPSAETTSTTRRVTTSDTVTTAPLGPSVDDLVEQALALYRGQQEMLEVDTREPGAWAALYEWIETNTAGSAKELLLQIFDRVQEDGEDAVGFEPLWVITDIDRSELVVDDGEISGSVVVWECSLERLELYNGDGQVVHRRPTVFTTWGYRYVYDQSLGRFLLTEEFPEDERCDPVEELKGGNGPISSPEEVQDVLAVHERLASEANGGIDTRVRGWGPVYDSLAATTTGTAIELGMKWVSENEAEGNQIDGGGYEAYVVGLTIDDDRARVLECSREAIGVYDAAGFEIDPAETWFELRELFLVKEDGQWKVDYYWEKSKQPCDPENS